MALTPQVNSRIANAAGAWQAACGIDVTAWDKAADFIVSCFAYADSVNPDDYFKIQWRRAGGRQKFKGK